MGQYSGVGRWGETWQTDLPKNPRRLQRHTGLIIDLIEKLYSPIIARDSSNEC